MNAPGSTLHVSQWINDPRIEIQDYRLKSPGEYSSWNQFFARNLEQAPDGSYPSRPVTMPDRDYVVVSPTGRGPGGWMKANLMRAGLGSVMFLGSYDTSRKLLEKFVPSPGEGPDPELQEAGFFNLMQIGTLPDGRLLRTRITGDQDPGYGSTSKMLSECAVCLARDELESDGGILTPAAAMAAPLLERLRANAGLTFELRD